MSEIPTIEEFMCKEYECEFHKIVADPEHIKWMIKEVAKLHVEAALKAANENAIAKEDHKDFGTGAIWVDSDSILNAYPLTNIK